MCLPEQLGNIVKQTSGKSKLTQSATTGQKGYNVAEIRLFVCSDSVNVGNSRARAGLVAKVCPSVGAEAR
jgi:hypothetical protein